MVEISNVKVYDLEECIIACRNAMRLEPAKSLNGVYTEEELKASLERAKKLCQAPSNSGHANFLTGIRVSFDLKYSQYITKQFQRYHWFDYVSSSSLMHRLTKMDANSICNKYVSKASVEQLQKDIDEYNEIVCMENYPNGGNPLVFELRDGTVVEAETKSDALYCAYMKCISDCPMGVELFVRVSTNYMQLRTIYAQRKNHKLKEDWGAVCRMIENLPYAKEFLLGNQN